LAPGAPLTEDGLARCAARGVTALRRRITRVTAAGSTPSRIAEAAAGRCAGPITVAAVEIGAVALELEGARTAGPADEVRRAVFVSLALRQAGPVAANEVVRAGVLGRAVAPALPVARAGWLQRRPGGAVCRLAFRPARVALAATAAARPGGTAGSGSLIGAGTTCPATAVVAAGVRRGALRNARRRWRPCRLRR
jgi:hypothetical protein